jgi:hypothetical protein
LISPICAGSVRADAGQPARWQIAKHGDGWRLLNRGEPFYVRGAVGSSRFDVLRACGGNAVRAPARKATLDAAQEEGLAVMANLPVRGQRSGMDWGDAEQVAQQQRKVLDRVADLKDHPALMFWAYGNVPFFVTREGGSQR